MRRHAPGNGLIQSPPGTGRSVRSPAAPRPIRPKEPSNQPEIHRQGYSPRHSSPIKTLPDEMPVRHAATFGEGVRRCPETDGEETE